MPRLNSTRLVRLVVVLIGLSAIGLIFKQSKNTLPHIEDLLQSTIQPKHGKNIFFVETNCSWHEHSKAFRLLNLTVRQACAVESAALHNPSFQVFVLFACSTYREAALPAPIKATLGYKNVQLRQLQLLEYVKDTPVEQWFQSGAIYNSSYIIIHMSDFLRLVTLYRYGGLYVDTDVVVLRSLEHVPPNFAALESDAFVANGVLSLAQTGIGHSIAESCLRDFQQNFNGSAWAQQGPLLVTRVMHRICNTTDLKSLVNNRADCQSFRVFDSKAFYAVNGDLWRNFFEPSELEPTLELTKSSYMVHLWNNSSKALYVSVGSKSPYDVYAKKHCPKVYATAGKYF
ncbi:lactosylceramide 4-alpha-galactosyltransferase-like isoform X1 [Drosophila busckii]|uniref:lactosylceramide 4-alpha-galactosyltransferase-like isoform X1 n=1 Tax=Drosophila busckii TaxID=30019 RepID=UPI00083E9AA6|nr:lactosylceramide 4-alpha-galactosyltransferase-like isoform X1 [Drosophila busckii]XP_017854040.1 lactosylceramide 4-alpha-galactosyltransferase-like isoform X1 [Drosophila busckii]